MINILSICGQRATKEIYIFTSDLINKVIKAIKAKRGIGGLGFEETLRQEAFLLRTQINPSE